MLHHFLRRVLSFVRNIISIHSKEIILNPYELKTSISAQAKAHQRILQVGADQELPAGDECTEIGDKLDDEGLEGVTLFDKPQGVIKKTIADGLYVEFCMEIVKV